MAEEREMLQKRLAGEDLVAHEMQTDDLGTGGGIVKIIVHGLFDAGAQLLEGAGLGFHTNTQGQGGISTTDFILTDFKDNFSHPVTDDIAAAARLQAWNRERKWGGPPLKKFQTLNDLE